MVSLIHTRLIRYIRSPLTWVTLAVSLIFGIFNGIKAGREIEMQLRIGLPTLGISLNNVAVFAVEWLIIVTVALSAGREFSDGTVRSKLTVGRTKTEIYLAEVVAALAFTLPAAAAFLVPAGICGRAFFSVLPYGGAVKWFAVMAMFFVVLAMLAVGVSFLAANITYGTVIAFCLELVMILASYNLYPFYSNTQPEFMAVVHGTEVGEDGNVHLIEEQVRNPYYLEGIPKMIVDAEHHIDAVSSFFCISEFFCVYDADGLLRYYGGDEDAAREVLDEERNISAELACDGLWLVGMSVLFSAAGIVLFRKKDLK